MIKHRQIIKQDILNYFYVFAVKLTKIQFLIFLKKRTTCYFSLNIIFKQLCKLINNNDTDYDKPYIFCRKKSFPKTVTDVIGEIIVFF